MTNSRPSPRADCLRRLLAAGCAALIFALGLFAASPVLHGQLHHDAIPSVEDGCAVVLFAGGVAVPLAAIAAPLPSAEWSESVHLASPEICLDSPRYLHQPGRGPPMLG